MSIIKIGKVRPTYRGEWNSETVYEALDWVTYRGLSYTAVEDVPLNFEPDVNPEYWAQTGHAGGAGGGTGDTPPLSDSVTTGDRDTAASSYAVKLAYDKAVSAENKARAAQTTADAAKADAATAQSTAAAAKSAASAAQTTASAAQNAATAAQTTADAAKLNSGNAVRWDGATKHVQPTAPATANGANGDIWFYYS